MKHQNIRDPQGIQYLPVNILIVDDEPKNLTVLESVLDDPAYRLVRATNADQALHALVVDEFALLILDIRMPDMNGFELAKIIKERKKTAQVPIIFLTAYYNEDQHVLEGYDTGAVDYLHKPVNPIILRSKVSVFVDLYLTNRKYVTANGALLAEVSNRLKVEETLRNLNQTLEHRVTKRTAELRENQSSLRYAADAARLTYVEVDFALGRTQAAENFATVMGYNSQLEGEVDVSCWTRLLLEHIVPEDRVRMESALQHLVGGEPVGKIDYRVLGDDRIERWVESAWSVDFSLDGKPLKMFVTNLDITARKRAEACVVEAMAEVVNERNRLDAVMESLPVGLVLLDTQGGEIRANPAFERIWGGPRPKPKGVADHEIYKAWWVPSGRPVEPEDWASALALRDGEVVLGQEMEIERFDGTRAVVLSSAAPVRDSGGFIVGCAAALMDITGRKHAEECLRQAQKLESLGLLAGGVAHDFNNLLVGIIGNASLAQDLLDPGNPVAELLDEVVKTGEQAAHLTRQMLAYSGKGKFIVEPLDLSAIICEMCSLVRPSISKKISLRLELDPDLLHIEADRGQLQQVFMNLTLNAAEAIGDGEGQITVKTCDQVIDEAYKKRHPETAALPPGLYVSLKVLDDGSGMDEATKARIFEPFFSTKFVGRGLGLAAVAGILRGHNGEILVSSALGQGSCFTVLFPAVVRQGGRSHAADRPATLQGAGVVLVVDDELVVRNMARQTLERYGYTVLLADSGMAAIDVFRRHPGEIALTILDLSMPVMRGDEALPELRKIRPGGAILVSSGYAEAETLAKFKDQHILGFIQKPFTAEALAQKVKASL